MQTGLLFPIAERVDRGKPVFVLRIQKHSAAPSGTRSVTTIHFEFLSVFGSDGCFQLLPHTEPNAHECPFIAPANESARHGPESAVTRPTGRREYVLVGSTAATDCQGWHECRFCRSKNLPCRRRLSVEQPHPLRNQHCFSYRKIR